MILQTYSENRGQDKAKAQRITINGREFSLPFFCFKIPSETLAFLL
uniref:Uncharacterized protein n=1 Tax=Siphoviridae sp. cttU829 TaxID=2823605 RepID=A0A8S5LCD1_9CAUD|nr:MAG TPA: hypothetical protein [Siphoviridae sp. cttU829]